MSVSILGDVVDRAGARRMRLRAALRASAPALSAKFKDATAAGADLPVRRGLVAGLQRCTLERSSGPGRRRQSRLSPRRSPPMKPSRRARRRRFPGLLPHADAIGHVTANKQSNNRPLRSADQPTYYGDNLLGAQASYEIDIWGRVRDIAASANATAEAAATLSIRRGSSCMRSWRATTSICAASTTRRSSCPTRSAFIARRWI